MKLNKTDKTKIKVKKPTSVEEFDKIGNSFKATGKYISPKEQLFLPVGQKMTLRKFGTSVQA